MIIFPPEQHNGETVNVKIKAWEDGRLPLFTSEERIFDQNIITEESYVPIKGRTIFENSPNPTTFVLNPFSVPSKEFTPEEVQTLLSGKFYQPDQERKATMGNNILISAPDTYPTAMAQAIIKYCTTRKEVSGAYLALMEDTSSDEAPHLLIGLNVKGNLREIFGELNHAIRPHIAVGEPVDMVELSSSKKYQIS